MKRATSCDRDVEMAEVALNEVEFEDEEDFHNAQATRSRKLLLTESPTTRAASLVFYVVVNALGMWAIAAANGSDVQLAPRSADSCWLYALFVFSLAAHFAVRYSDPGYVEAPEGDDEAHSRADYGQRKEAAAAASAAIGAQLAAPSDVPPESTLLPWPAWPPMRTAYCRPVRRWVATYDHYCPLVATPIGERNRGRFLVYLLAQMLALGRAAGAVETAVRWQDVAGGNEGTFALCLILWLLFAASFLFFGFHCFLALTNLTTYEFLSAGEIDYLHGTEDFDLPFTRGLRSNVAIFFASDGAFAFIRGRDWSPTPWVRPAFIVRDSDDWWNNLWQNKYWSCC